VHPEVRIRQLRGRDSPEVLKWVADPTFRGDFLWLSKASMKETAKEVRKLMVSRNPRLIGVEETQSRRLVGLVLCHRPRGFDYYEVGFYLEPSVRGRGYGPAALGLLVDRLLRRNRVETIMAGTTSLNAHSQRALEKAGFSKEGVWKNTLFRHGRWEDSVIFTLSRGERLADAGVAKKPHATTF
jgi:RimJ/RimL family protein N-acetyltransferase